MASCIGVLAAAGASVGCGDGEGTEAQGEPRALVASEPSRVFAERLAKLLETTTTRRQCPQLEEINQRSFVRFPCPPARALAKSMGSFRVVGAGEYGSGAIVDYKSGKVDDGAAIVLFVAPNRGWGIGRFGVLTEPSIGTSDEDSRDGYAEAVDDYIAAVRKRNCAEFRRVAFVDDLEGKDLCKRAFARIQTFVEQQSRHPNSRPKYEGGNGTYGFFSVETAKPNEKFTISVVRSAGGENASYTVLDAAPSPTSVK